MIEESDGVTDDLRAAGNVTRYACWPTLMNQSVGNHCWHIYRIYCDLWQEWPSAEVAYFIMHHDSDELITGDAPFPVKARNPDLKAAHDRVGAEARKKLGVRLPKLSAEDLARIKICDLLEMTSYGMLEREMGNAHAAAIVVRTAETAERLALEKLGPAAHSRVQGYVTVMWRTHERVLRGADVSCSYRRR